MASKEELMSFYANYYDKGNFGSLDYKNRVRNKITTIQNGNHSLSKKEKSILTYAPKGNFLDLGFGLGEELALFSQLGFSVFGTEFDQDCIQFIQPILPNATLFQGDLLETGYPDNFFDVIHMYHVIEHLLDPNAYIRELNRILKPGGILIIGTPDIGSAAYKIFRLLNFITLRVPLIVDGLEHTVIFNQKNLSDLIKKNDFDVLDHYSESVGDSFSNIWSSNLSLKKKIVRYLQTFVKINQVIIAKKN
ncbi:MAG: class I SAM-dependent methyltransferase [Bacteroidetes bacterium]|nr:class I SAM-dependent methyltransferase [Bacteroidota bacterium]